MLLHEGLTHIQSQIKPRLLFGKSLILMLHEHYLIVPHVMQGPTQPIQPLSP